jgi:hypothetical protein
MQSIPSQYKDQQSHKNSTSIVLRCVFTTFIAKKHLSVVQLILEEIIMIFLAKLEAITYMIYGVLEILVEHWGC